MQQSYISHDSICIDGTLFRTESSQKKNMRTDNSGIMMDWFHDDELHKRTAYGVLTDIIEHQLCAGCPRIVLFKAKWYTNKRKLHKNKMQVLKFQNNEIWNTGTTQFDLISKITPQNVGFAARDSRKWGKRGVELIAFKRRAEEHIDWGLA
jgi:hypothetical protein